MVPLTRLVQSVSIVSEIQTKQRFYSKFLNDVAELVQIKNKVSNDRTPIWKLLKGPRHAVLELANPILSAGLLFNSFQLLKA